MVKQPSYNKGMDLERLARELNDRDWDLTRLMNEARVYRPRLSWRTVSEVASGKRVATLGIVQPFAKALGVPVDYLQGKSQERSQLEPGSDADIPIPKADVAPLVEQLNKLPSGLRVATTQAVTVLLDAIEASFPTSEYGRQAARLFDTWSPERQAEETRELERILGEAAQIKNDGRPPVGKRTGRHPKAGEKAEGSNDAA